jgi:dienelactone hydrolase
MRLLLLLASFAVSGCVATTTVALDDATKPRVSIYKTFLVSTQAPTVIISHGSAGVDSPTLRMATKVQAWGYNAVVIDHYTAKGISQGRQNIGKIIEGATGSERALDAVAVARWIQRQTWHKGKIVLIGYSQGGATVNALANKYKITKVRFPSVVTNNDYSVFAGAIGMYPSCGMLLDATPPSDEAPFPVQLHIGTADDLARPEWCETRAKNYELVYYKGATHLFDSQAQNTKFTQRYDRAADQLSSERIRIFLDAHLQRD